MCQCASLWWGILGCWRTQCEDEGTVRQRGGRQVCDSGYCTANVTIFFFPPVWPIRTRHGPYNSVSGEKHLEKGLVWSKNAGKSSHQHKQKTKQKRNQNDPQIPQPDLRFAIKQTAKQQRTGPGPNKNQTKQLEICLEYSDLSHCIVIKNMQTN